MMVSIFLIIGWLLQGPSLALATPPDDAPTPSYSDHQDLMVWIDGTGARHPTREAADWLIRRDHVLQHVQRVMGDFPTARPPIPLDLREEQRETLGNVERRKVSFCTDSTQQRVSAWLLLPQPARANRAAVLCLHQTVEVGKNEPAGIEGASHLHYAWELAQRGFVTLAPDYPSLGEYRYDFADDRYVSGSMKAICDNRRAIDLLQSLPEVNTDRIGCIGHSLGGHNAIFTAVFDERLKAIVSCCGFTRFHRYMGGQLQGWSGPRYMPRIASEFGNDPDRVPFDFTELIGALAPRAFLAIAPQHDDNFDVQGVHDVMDAARNVYRLFDRETHLQANYPDCGHTFPEEQRTIAYAFLATHLSCAEENAR
ncbi:MAG: prolyl oligopeptidase family serine peptidase [Planctomycetota bacterium]|nr:prolyl oligopeptidase family serine peptidase [Planctomycetota bacterium]MDA1178507.1 prolyl oligopeptidase family serine peptidase [Planctomycetota bacterium]